MIVNRLNNRIEFWSDRPHKDDYGEVVNTPEKVCTLWADIAKDSLKEYKERSYDDYGSHRISFLIDHRASLKVEREMEIHFHGDVYDIIDIERDYAQKDYTKIMAKKVDK